MGTHRTHVAGCGKVRRVRNGAGWCKSAGSAERGQVRLCTFCTPHPPHSAPSALGTGDDLSTAYEGYDLDLGAFLDHRLGIPGALDHHAIVLDSDEPWIDVESFEQPRDRQRAVELSRLAVQLNAHRAQSYNLQLTTHNGSAHRPDASLADVVCTRGR